MTKTLPVTATSQHIMKGQILRASVMTTLEISLLCHFVDYELNYMYIEKIKHIKIDRSK